MTSKKPETAARPAWPDIYVTLWDQRADTTLSDKFVKARIKERTVGPTVFRYLSYRDGPTVRNLYLGSCTPRNHAQEAPKR